MPTPVEIGKIVGNTVYLKKMELSVCTICQRGVWITSEGEEIGPKRVTWLLKDLEIVEFNNRYYMVPKNHKECRRLFDLCPPL